MNQTTSLYRFFGADGELLYIGITNCVPRRLDEHGDDKPWFTEACTIAVEHHPSREAALAAEKTAIQAEKPKYNVQHNRGRISSPAATESRGRWTFRSRESGIHWQADLYLYPELDCSAVVDDYYWLDSEGQFEEYVQYLERRYAHWLESDAVPIAWTVRSRNGRSDVFEAAPFQQSEAPWRDFLTYFTWPTDALNGDRLDWYQLPVVNDRFPEFAKALAWTPSPLQPTCPLRSILASRSGHRPPAFRAA